MKLNEIVTSYRTAQEQAGYHKTCKDSNFNGYSIRYIYRCIRYQRIQQDTLYHH